MKSLANICCSFELEPQTLSEGQLTQARKLAQNQEPTEASTTLFNRQGLADDAIKRGISQMGQIGGQAEKMQPHGCRPNKDHKTCHCICTT